MREIHDRLRRIEGQVRGIQRMVTEERPCDDVLAQVMAVRAALERAAALLVENYLEDCMTSLPPQEARAAIRRTLRLLTKTS
ncbi:MAG TPA: metal-sensitive transcriptional regulator [Dehalococcoidia bacterium]|nr:metal-sensitive transcriptional regulator [Dehalococcoidia bacterium]